MVAKKNIGSIKKWADLDHGRFTVFVKLGTTGDIYATKHLKKAKIRRMDTEADAAQAVALGRADAFVYDKPYLEIYASSQAGKIALLDDVLTSESFGLAARKVDRDLIEAVDAFLVQWRASGGYQAAYKAMFQDLVWKKHFPHQF
jgi:polar amino acid transport system substrate-binding protein